MVHTKKVKISGNSLSLFIEPKLAGGLDNFPSEDFLMDRVYLIHPFNVSIKMIEMEDINQKLIVFNLPILEVEGSIK
jgi:hypothetical protein